MFFSLLILFFFWHCTSSSNSENKKSNDSLANDTIIESKLQKQSVPEIPECIIDVSGAYKKLEPKEYPRFYDTMKEESILQAAKSSLQYFDTLTKNGYNDKIIYDFGDFRLKSSDLKKSVNEFIAIYKQAQNKKATDSLIREKFHIYQLQIPPGNSGVLFTSYYEPPSYKASLTKNGDYIFPMYATPTDLVSLEEHNFGNQLNDDTIFCSLIGSKLYPYKSGEKITVVSKDFKNKWTGGKITGRIENQRMIPYYTREEIDVDKILIKKNLATPIAWFKSPAALMDVHLQGSGWLILPDETKRRAHFTFTNSLPYKSYVTIIARRNKLSVSKDAVHKFLDQNQDKAQQELTCNPRYVFFELAGNKRLGETKTPLVPFRSAAVDTRYLPLGSVFMATANSYTKTKNGKMKDTEAVFMFSHDVGGAIKKNHIDYYVGNDLTKTIYDKNGKVFLLILKQLTR